MKLHFIGIGGIGVSALARYYLAQGHRVSGSDLVSSEITEALEKMGAKIFIGKHKRSALTGSLNSKFKIQNLPDLVIYSPAVPKNNPELKEALKIKNLKLKIKILSYPQALGELTKKYFTIAVCGTHGKSTTTAMIGLILTKAGFNPTVILGTKLKEFGDTNCRVGNSRYLVIEADEHFASFLNYWPKIIVLTALEPDHLDYYKNFKNYLLAFKKFIFHLPKAGFLVANRDDKNIESLISKLKNQKPKLKFKIQNYSLNQPEARKLKGILKIPGEFNISNALAALKTARILKIPDKISFKALSQYRGAWRRFQIQNTIIKRTIVRIMTGKGVKKGKKIKKAERKRITLVSDYGHHPTEVRETLKACREKFPRRKIWCVFQPHQYQRTYYLFEDFVKVFQMALNNRWINKLILAEIYNVVGREDKKIKKKINSKKLIKAIKKKEAIYLPKKRISSYLKKNLQGGETLIVMGAGDIYLLLKELENGF